MLSDFANNYWPLFGAVVFLSLFIFNKVSEKNDKKRQQSWIKSTGVIVRVFHHPKLNAYYVKFDHNDSIQYFEERRAFGDRSYVEDAQVPVLFDPKGEFLADIPAQDQTLFSSKLSVGSQQNGKINDNSKTSAIIDALIFVLFVACLITQWSYLS